ncbi:MAG: radical SAM protein [Nitrososphaerota archaeon]
MGTGYDVVFLHPPAIFDFRDKPFFPGPIAYTVSESTHQFIIPPIGMLSIADYLDRNGYKVYVDNIGERMLQERRFSVEDYLEKIDARIFAIDLHWIIHAHGAINLARICKNIHPDSLIVLGGLTATRFHDEIIEKYPFIDVVVRGEAEEAFLKLMVTIETKNNLGEIPNTTYRVDGKIRIEPLSPPADSIDKYEFTRLDLLKPRTLLFSVNKPPYCAFWQIPICRGCIYNCATCGGSRYVYKKYLGRHAPSFRKPEKIVEDLDKLAEQGVKTVFLFQDARMGGRKYWKQLLKTLRTEGVAVEHLTLELFEPASEEYIKEVSRLGTSVTLTISPESGSEYVRKKHGRNYSNIDIFNTIKKCQEHHVPVLVFFMVALAYEDMETIKETWSMWEKICMIDMEARSGKEPFTAGYGYGQMILIDPGSLAFDDPPSHGYKLNCRNLEEHVNSMSQPSWHQWINYETNYLDRRMIARLMIDSLEYSINLREKFGVYERLEAFYERLFFVNINRMIIDKLDQIMILEDEVEREKRTRELYEVFLSYIEKTKKYITFQYI